MKSWQQEARKRKSTKKTTAKKPAVPEVQQPPIRPGMEKAIEIPKTDNSFKVYFESSAGVYWCQDGKGKWRRNTKGDMADYYKTMGYHSTKGEGSTASEIDMLLHRVRYFHGIDWAGELAGYQCGLQEVTQREILIVASNRPIVPKQGPFPLIRSFLRTLLGKEQLPYFLGWCKGSLESLKRGYPFRPGQLVAFAGSVNSGKSFVQLLITHLFGGRQGDPTDYLLGQTAFTADFFRAEHLLIEDKALKDFSNAKRRAFAANLKGLIVNQEQRVHPKGKEAFLLPVGTRVSLSCNDAPEALAILPALDNDVADKVLYFMCGEGELPRRKDDKITLERQLSMFKDELPGFVHWLESYEVPPEVRDPRKRFTVREWHHPEIVARLRELTPEQRLLELLQVLPLKWDCDSQFRGTATAVERWIREADNTGQLDRLTNYQTKVGHLLTKLCREGEEAVRILESEERCNTYLISREEL